MQAMVVKLSDARNGDWYVVLAAGMVSKAFPRRDLAGAATRSMIDGVSLREFHAKQVDALKAFYDANKALLEEFFALMERLEAATSINPGKILTSAFIKGLGDPALKRDFVAIAGRMAIALLKMRGVTEAANLTKELASPGEEVFHVGMSDMEGFMIWSREEQVRGLLLEMPEDLNAILWRPPVATDQAEPIIPPRP